MIVPRVGEGGSRLALEAVSAVNSDLLKDWCRSTPSLKKA
jgi:hypothetical protein